MTSMLRTEVTGADPNCAQVRADLKEALFVWLSQRKIRTTIAGQEVAARTNRHKALGVLFGVS